MPTNRKTKKQNTPAREGHKSSYSSGNTPHGGAERSKKAAPYRPKSKKNARPQRVEEKPQGDQPEIGTIQWFPGHMARTRRKIKESIGMVDAVVEIVDARIPLASRNPELDSLTDRKPRLVILNKADLADEAVTRRWIAYFRAKGTPALAMDCKSGRGFNSFLPALRELLHELIEKWESRGMTRS
ncbi:MAG: hypothetical protein IIW40_03315, partial [Clostridia bacterium]|nr:hypothetical protein [Clostridia bacterium]